MTSISGAWSRYAVVGGFGAIHWLDSIGLDNPFAADDSETGMIEHMNADHATAIAHYVELADLPRHKPAQLVSIDSEGFHLRIGHSLHWLAFPEPCRNPGQVRAALVALARADRWPQATAASA